MCRVKRLLLATPFNTSQKSILFRRYIDSVESKIQLLIVCAWNMYVREVLCVITWGSSLSGNIMSVFWSVIERPCVCSIIHTQLPMLSAWCRVCLARNCWNPGGDHSTSVIFFRQMENICNLEWWQHNLLSTFELLSPLYTPCVYV